ncbi:hypothetical protein D9757_010308 [Collybiopsis confluens]|uniref:BTB domain-containing protein n=1 Tax=Collybiopsis confluens TaxID=2823264 RepID=A0A8H5GUE3_9AGAR|nr:hypothetical protein D9757_010308 [Collybiopsis confluens]
MSESNPDSDNTSDSRTSKLFSSADADIIFQSSDNVQFHLHKINLQYTTGGFPPADISNKKEIVKLTEQSETLELLFQFVYPRQFPSMRNLDFHSLISLAEAAEKYEVFAASTACFYLLRDFVHTQPKRVLQFAAMHGYHELVVDIQPILAGSPLSDVVDILPLQMLKSWSLYREQHLLTNIQKHLETIHALNRENCNLRSQKAATVYEDDTTRRKLFK